MFTKEDRDHQYFYLLEIYYCTLPLLQQIRHQDDRILHIIQYMDNIGWKNLGFGLIPQQWTQYQTQRLKNSNSKLSGVHWMSKLIRQIWKLHKKMWLDQNSYVHRGCKSIHAVEEEAINNAICL